MSVHPKSVHPWVQVIICAKFEEIIVHKNETDEQITWKHNVSNVEAQHNTNILWKDFIYIFLQNCENSTKQE